MVKKAIFAQMANLKKYLFVLSTTSLSKIHFSLLAA